MAVAAPARGSGFIAGPLADTVFLIAAPLVALLVFIPFGVLPVLDFPFEEREFGSSLANGFISSIIFAHLFIVFFRSHLNPRIFRLHRARFIAIPILLVGAMLYSPVAIAYVAVLSLWWDVYHSSLQTFGIGRIYDMRAGNDPRVGRRLDWIWNLVMYAGPILAGASLLDHVGVFSTLDDVGDAFFTHVPAVASEYSAALTWGVLAFAVPFSVYYLHATLKLRRQGYRISPQKVSLYLILGCVSVFCWGFNSFGEAFFVMNFFHALQYFFIVWHNEGNNIEQRFGLAGTVYGRPLALALFLLIATTFGVWATGAWSELVPAGRLFPALVLTVSILHFWYDGFIWSVQRKQVR